MTSFDKFIDALTENGWEITTQYLVGHREELPIDRYNALLAKGVLVDPEIPYETARFGKASFDIVVVQGTRRAIAPDRGGIAESERKVRAAFYEYNGALASYIYNKPVLEVLLSEVNRYGNGNVEYVIRKLENGKKEAERSLERYAEDMNEYQAKKDQLESRLCESLGCSKEQLHNAKKDIIKLGLHMDRGEHTVRRYKDAKDIKARYDESLAHMAGSA